MLISDGQIARLNDLFFRSQMKRLQVYFQDEFPIAEYPNQDYEYVISMAFSNKIFFYQDLKSLIELHFIKGSNFYSKNPWVNEVLGLEISCREKIALILDRVNSI